MRKPGPTASRMRAGLLARGDDAVEAGFARQLGAAQHEVGGAERGALLLQVVGGEVGQHGDGEQLHLAGAASRHGGAHGLEVVAVHGEEVDAELGRVGDRALDRVADVEQLHVEEDVLALAL